MISGVLDWENDMVDVQEVIWGRFSNIQAGAMATLYSPIGLSHRIIETGNASVVFGMGTGVLIGAIRILPLAIGERLDAASSVLWFFTAIHRNATALLSRSIVA